MPSVETTMVAFCDHDVVVKVMSEPEPVCPTLPSTKGEPPLVVIWNQVGVPVPVLAAAKVMPLQLIVPLVIVGVGKTYVPKLVCEVCMFSTVLAPG